MQNKQKIDDFILKTEKIDVSELVPLQGELKKLDDVRFNKLRNSLIEKGFRFTIHAWESGNVNYILDGHQRVHVLQQLQKQGFDIPKLTVNFVKAKDFHEAKELILYAVSQYGKIDKDGFEDFIDGLNFDFGKFDLPDFAYDFSELEESKIEPENDPNDVPEIPEDENPYNVKLGQIWKLGKHRLMCGDSTSEQNAKILLDNEKPDFVLTDPPYELDVKKVSQSLKNSQANHYILICTFKQAAELYAFDLFDFRFDFVINAHVPKSFMNQKQPYYTHQTGVYFSSKNFETIFDCKNTIGIRSDKAYWHTIIDAPRSTQTGHGHSKNIKGMIDVMSGFSGSKIFEPFCGSGSTLIACEIAQKSCFAIELSEKYCSLTIKRWEDYTGQTAELIVS